MTCFFCRSLRSFVQVAVVCALISSNISTAQAQSSSTSSCIVSSGDAAVGVAAIHDPSCLDGGIGCFDDRCRFCQTKATPQSSQFLSCLSIKGSSSTEGSVDNGDAGHVPVLNNGDPAKRGNSSLTREIEQAVKDTTKVCSTTVSEGDASVGISIMTDNNCTNGGVGCMDDICRLCQAKPTPQSSHLQKCLADSTNLCSQVASEGDAANGIRIVTDATCAHGGLGCIDNVCRFCRNITASSSYVACASIERPTGPAVATPTLIAPGVISPAATPATSTKQMCSQTVSDGDAAVGIKIVTDNSCSFGGLGCIDQVCRFCRVTTTVQSSPFVDCALIKDTIPATTPTTPASTTAPSIAADSASPSIVFECSRTISSGDKSVGLDIVSDIRCSDGGTGCVSDVCRFCKRFDTVQAQSYLSCSSIPLASIGSDINFMPIPVIDVPKTDTPSDMIVPNHESVKRASKSVEPCASVPLADGQAAGGIGVVLDTAHCPEGLSSGCIGDAGCRYCMRFRTSLSEHLEYCAIVNNTDVAYPISNDGSASSTAGDSANTRSVQSSGAVSAEDRAANSNVRMLVKSEWFIRAMACIGVIGIVGLTAFGIKQTIGNHLHSGTQSSNKERVVPDDEQNRPSVLTTSNVDDPGVITDV